MNLQSMTEFVLQQKEKLEFHMNDTILETGKLMQKIFKYAEFLKQPLTLGMFVPVGENGEILEESQTEFKYLINSVGDDGLKEYEKAKEEVLFKGFSLHIKDLSNNRKFIYLKYSGRNMFKVDNLNKFTIEDILNVEEELVFELTESALKQIGLKTN